MSLPRLNATRYVTALKEGGSLPAIVDTDDGLFVVKFRGAGQGAKALIAEILVGGLATALELPVPPLALIDLDESFGRGERDPEIRDILKGSIGTNVGMRYLEGAFNFDGAADQVDPELASRLVWLDAFTTNVDRTARNPNLMWAADQIWLIDHGAALYFHHGWDSVSPANPADRFAFSSEHVLLGRAEVLEDADQCAHRLLDTKVLERIVDDVPDELLMDSPAGSSPPFPAAQANREAYLEYFSERLEQSAVFLAAALESFANHSTPETIGYRR